MRIALKNPLFTATLLVGLSASGLANAQTSAGQLLQQNRELEPQPPLLPEVSRETGRGEIKPLELKPGQLTFVAKRFVFVGNTKVSDSELQSLVSNFIGKTITFEDLKLITDAVTDYYHGKGYLVRTILPQQDITDGTVTIRVIEAKLSNIKIDNESKRVSDARVEQWVYGLIPKASELSLKELDRAILTLNDLPDIAVTGTLEEGTKPGDTVLLLTVADKPLVNGQVTADNYGDSNSGRARASALVNVNSPLGIGDQLSVYGMYSQGNSYGRLSYTLPVGSDGLRVGVNGSSMSYRVLNNNFQSAYVNGFANTGGVEATYPLIRTRPMNLVGLLNWNYNQFRNWSNGNSVPENSYDTSVAQFGASGNLIDGVFGGGLSTASLIGSYGDIQKNASTTAGQAAGVAGSFSKLRYAANRNQAITDSFSVYLGVSGQLASKNMDSSEQLYLGGPMSVRAYSSGQGAASQGNLTTLELRQNLPYQTQAIAFYDLGNVQVSKFNTQNLAYNNYVLQGYGLGLNWIGPHGVSLKASWAQRSGQLSQPVSTYLSQNGGTSANRFWITGSIQF